MTWETELSPKINCSLENFRKQAKPLGYKVETRIISFIDLARTEKRAWKLTSIDKKITINPKDIFSKDYIEKHQEIFNLINKVTAI